MAVAEGVVGQFDFGRVVKNTFQVIGSNLKELLVLSALLSGLPALALGWAQVAYAGGEAPSAATGLATFGLGAVGFVVAVIGSALLQATIVRVAVSTLNGQSASAFAEMRKSIPFIAPLLGLGLLVGLGVALYGALLWTFEREVIAEGIQIVLRRDPAADPGLTATPGQDAI